MITLYHGSNVEIGKIDLSRGKRGKDFGRGFYLNANYEQARQMAERTTKILGYGHPIVTAFEFDNDMAESIGLKVKCFPDYSEEWAEFVVNNRRNDSDIQIHDYDIVIGPIADDTVGVQIRRYIMGYMSAAALVEELKFHGDHAVQYFFGSELALKLLKKSEI